MSFSYLVADCLSPSLPLKKREQISGSPQCDSGLFKAPYPYKRHSGPFQPVPRRVPPLYQPWTHPSSRIKPHFMSAFRDYRNCPELNHVPSVQSEWRLSHLPQPPPLLSGPTNYNTHTSTLRPVSMGTQALYNGSVCERRLHTDMTNGRSKGPYIKRKESRAAENTHPPSPHSGDFELKLHQLDKPTKPHPILKVLSSENLRETSTRLPPPPSSLNPAPWLLPHFGAGSLIELRDGRLRRVEHLQTEDFLLGSLACPDLRLSCCTVQRIYPSTQTSVSRLLILLHEQHTQELVDVYVEYPFFVRDRGWSSCSPPRTARLCGLQCRQLSVGDVCLALTPALSPALSSALSPSLTPVSAPQLPVLPEPGPPPNTPHPPGTTERQGGRKRHVSAPS